MKEKNISALFVIIAICTLLCQESTAQYSIPHSAIGSGFANNSNNNFAFTGTIGQSIIGLISNSDYVNSLGFWYNLHSMLTNIEDSPQTIPLKYFLGQNYPNPFNPITKIKYTVPKLSHVKIEIFNILGQRVGLLIDKNIEPGIHSINFDGSNLASGFYIYRMYSNEFNSTKRMLLIK